jgi:tetrahydromethanopterin S-methyltransferase subunit E
MSRLYGSTEPHEVAVGITDGAQKEGLALMQKSLRARFWVESVLATITGVLFVVTLFVRNWIEVVFGVDPDRQNGALEWAIVGTLLVVTLLFSALARAEWKRAIRLAA